MAPERQVLGRGLDELLGRVDSRSVSSSKSDVENKILLVGIERIKPDPQQPRRFFDEKTLEELALSLKQQGMLQPILVSANKDGTYLIIAGERRWRAAQKISWSQVPVIVKQDEKEQAKRMTMALVENIQRENLNPMEEARAFQWLIQAKQWPQQKVADIVGRDRSSIANVLRLLHLHEDAQDLLAKNKISFSIAKLLLQEKEKERQKIWARMASQQQLTVRELEKKLKERNKDLHQRKKYRMNLPVWLKLACARMARKWNLDIALHPGVQRSSITISFTDPEQIKEFIDHV